MAKYNFEFKKKIVLEHLSLGVGSKTLAKKYNVKSARQIRQWIHNYDWIFLCGRLFRNYPFWLFQHDQIYSIMFVLGCMRRIIYGKV